MTYQEKKNIVNIFSGLLITAIFARIIYQKHLQGSFDLSTDFSSWGTIFLIFIGVSILARIIIYIISGLLAEIVENGSQIYYYRKGI